MKQYTKAGVWEGAEQWGGRRIEGWSNTAACLAGWRRVHGPAGRDFVRDGRSMPSALTDHTTCADLGLIYNWMYTKQWVLDGQSRFRCAKWPWVICCCVARTVNPTEPSMILLAGAQNDPGSCAPGSPGRSVQLSPQWFYWRCAEWPRVIMCSWVTRTGNPTVPSLILMAGAQNDPGSCAPGLPGRSIQLSPQWFYWQMRRMTQGHVLCSWVTRRVNPTKPSMILLAGAQNDPESCAPGSLGRSVQLSPQWFCWQVRRMTQGHVVQLLGHQDGQLKLHPDRINQVFSNKGRFKQLYTVVSDLIQ